MVVGTKRALCGGLAIAALVMSSCGDEVTCASAAGRGDWKRAVALCRERYRAGDLEAGLTAARAMRRSGDLRGTIRLTKAMLEGARALPPRLATDLYAVLGDAAQRADDPVEARQAWEGALAGARAAGDGSGIGRAAHGLAGANLALGDIGSANSYAELAIEEARRGGRAKEVELLYYMMGRADVLRQGGLQDESERLFAEMKPLLKSPDDKIWYALKLGILYVSRGLVRPARQELTLALELLALSPERLDDVRLSVLLNLAWMDRVEGKVQDALERLDAASKLEGAKPLEIAFHRGLVLADAGRLDEAASWLDEAQRELPQAQWSWAVPYNRGRVAEQRGQLEAAIAAYRDSITAVQALTERAGSFTPDVAANHREPYQRLLGIYARRGDWERAFQLVMELDLLSLVTSEVVPLTGQLDRAQPNHPSAPVLPRLPAVAEVLAAWRGRHLVVVVSDEETMWRLEIRDGQVSGRPVGEAARLERAAAELELEPVKTELASELGAAVLPPLRRASGGARGAGGRGAGREVVSDGEGDGVNEDVNEDVIDVLLVGPIARLPLAALRQGRQLAVAQTPLARVLGVLPRGERRPARQGAVVLGDPNGDLPQARAEAEEIAARLAVVPLLGEAVTRGALARAGGAALLHLAAHSSSTVGGARLGLSERSLGGGEIAESQAGAGVVVLASCGGAAARDAAGWGSLAAAFLRAGSDAVIAAGRSVDDEKTRALVRALYRQRRRGQPVEVARQPARALALAQVEMSASLPPEIWAVFAVLRAPPRLPAAVALPAAGAAEAAPAAAAR